MTRVGDGEDQPFEPWLGLLDPSVPRLAIVPVQFLRASSSEPMHRRVGGLPAALVPVVEGVVLDVSSLVLGWPTWMRALERAIGEEALASLLAQPPMFEGPGGKSIEDRIIEHSVRAENLLLLDGPLATASTPAKATDVRWAFASGVLEVHVPMWRCKPFEAAKGARARWNGNDVALFDDVPWTDPDLLGLSATLLGDPPALALKRFAAAMPDSGASIAAGAPLGAVLFAAGTQHARAGSLALGIAILERARPMVPAGELEGAVIHELALAKLKSTATSLTGPHAEYAFRAEHRPVWSECRALFEQAAKLDPSLPAAGEAARLETMIAMLDQPTRSPEAAPKKRRAAKSKPNADAEVPALSVWLPPAIIAVLLAVFFAYMLYRYLHPDG